MAKEKRKSFLLYESQRGMIGLLGEAERAALLSAIYDYAVTGSYEPLPSAATEVAFAAIRMQLDLDAQRYDEICAARRSAGDTRWKKEKEEKKDEKPPLTAAQKVKVGKKSKSKSKVQNANACKCTYDDDEDDDKDNDVDEDDDDDERRAKGGGSFDTDAFFGAALRRSYEKRDKDDAKKTT